MDFAPESLLIVTFTRSEVSLIAPLSTIFPGEFTIIGLQDLQKVVIFAIFVCWNILVFCVRTLFLQNIDRELDVLSAVGFSSSETTGAKRLLTALSSR